MSSEKYPFVPKTTAKLHAGSFWGIPLLSGRFGCGLVLDIDPAARMYLLIGLTDYRSDVPPNEENIKGRKLIDQGRIHLKSILLNGGQILGRINLDEYRLRPLLARDSNDLANGCILDGYREVRRQTREDSALPIMGGWGYMEISRRANALDTRFG